MLLKNINKTKNRFRAYSTRQGVQTTGSTAKDRRVVSRAVQKEENNAVWLDSGKQIAWDLFVSKNAGSLVYHQSAWKKVLEEAFSHIQGNFLMVPDINNRQIVAGLPVYIVNSWLLGKRIVSIPYASICNPLISNPNDFVKILPQLRKMQKKTRASYIEIKAINNSGLLSSMNLIPHINYKHNYVLLKGTIDDIFFRCSRNVRRVIKDAQKMQIVVEIAESKTGLKLFYEMLKSTRRRLALPSLPYRFYESIWQHLIPLYGKLFLASRNGSVLGGLLVLHANKVWVAEYICDWGLEESSYIKHILYWTAIKMAHAQDGKIFSFGRTSVNNKNLLYHKRKWGSLEEDLSDFRFSLATNEIENLGITHNREFTNTYRLIRYLCRVTPFPIYNMIGRFCYRHMG